jgi:hydrogenase nickel incorporation protein HypA/HybF
MHEVSLAAALIDLVQEQAAAVRARRVTRLVVEIGTLSHVETHALRFAVDAAAAGGLAEGAVLEIEEPEGVAYCLDCEASVPIAARGAPCPRCRGVKLLVQGGDEMRLKEMEVV